jgi:hypothetical protein
MITSFISIGGLKKIDYPPPSGGLRSAALPGYPNPPVYVVAVVGATYPNLLNLPDLITFIKTLGELVLEDAMFKFQVRWNLN